MALWTMIIEDDDGKILEALQFRINQPLAKRFKITPDGHIIEDGETCHF